MNLFEEELTFIEDWLAERERRGELRRLDGNALPPWPAAGQRNLVIGRDIAVELGHPDDGSVAFLVWSESTEVVRGGRTLLVGPDLHTAGGRRLPLAKVVMIQGRGFDADNACARYRRLEAVRYGIDLRGYMMRAASQVSREWSRVSHAALAGGFNFAILGQALIEAYTAIDFVDRADVLLVTASRADVMAFRPLADRVTQVIAAMNKMSVEMDLDCGNCTFAPVCEAVEGLRAMRRARENKHA